MRRTECFNIRRIRFNYVPRALNSVIEYDQSSSSSGFRISRYGYCIIKITRTISADSRGRSHGTNKHDGLLGLLHQIDKEASFLKRVRAMGNNYTIDII